jgi:hypothetical protein
VILQNLQRGGLLNGAAVLFGEWLIVDGGVTPRRVTPA